MLEPHFPLGANLIAVLAVFAFFFAAFDIALVRWLKLGKVAWKKIEYLWLGFAALALFGAVAQVRVITASAQVGMFQDRAAFAFSSLRRLADLWSSSPGAVCRTFVRSDYSPPPNEFDRLQREFNHVCEWFRGVAKAIPSEPSTPAKPINASSLPSRPQASSGDLKEMINGLYTQLDHYNTQIKVLNDLSQKTGRTDMESVLIYLGPFVLAIALALRITKVTGEIRLEKRGKSGVI